ncbi:unnamed protein product [Rotaria sp. Silwood2]|nr:unnamed protein product [Rotaria sp. Silwood2]
MENIEYLRLTFNRLDDDDIRLLTASNRIRSKALCNLHSLHLQVVRLFAYLSMFKQIVSSCYIDKAIIINLSILGNNLTSRSARFLKALTSLDTLYISLVASHDKSIFMKEFDNLHECNCSIQNGWEEIVNRGWIAKISQLQSSTTVVDNNFYRKRRRVDNDNSIQLIKLVRFCSTCHQNPSEKSIKKKEKIVSNTIGFIDSTQANDLLSCYL